MADYRKDEASGGKLEKISISDIALGEFDMEEEEGVVSNDTGYMNTPNFTKALTDLCDAVLKSDQREKTLLDGLDKINGHLPAFVYLPFVADSTRNYAVLHIRINEAKVFCTKSRAPFLCVFEVYRPEELKFK